MCCCARRASRVYSLVYAIFVCFARFASRNTILRPSLRTGAPPFKRRLLAVTWKSVHESTVWEIRRCFLIPLGNRYLYIPASEDTTLHRPPYLAGDAGYEADEHSVRTKFSCIPSSKYSAGGNNCNFCSIFLASLLTSFSFLLNIYQFEIIALFPPYYNKKKSAIVILTRIVSLKTIFFTSCCIHQNTWHPVGADIIRPQGNTVLLDGRVIPAPTNSLANY